MGWNQPTVLPYQPSTWERSTLPMLQQLGANVALMKMKQGFQAKQQKEQNIHAESLFRQKGMAEGMFREPTGKGEIVSLGGKETEIIPLKDRISFIKSGDKTIMVGPKGNPTLVETKQPAAILQEKMDWNKDNPSGTWEMFYEQRGGPKTLAQEKGAAFATLKPEEQKGVLIGKKPTYRTLGSSIYKIEDGKSELIQKGSMEERAVTNAMHDPNWIFADEIGQAELIEKHKRFLAGETKTTKKDYGVSEHPEGTTATNAEGIKIITKDGKWVVQ